MSEFIYADHASTTFLSPAALDAMMPYLTHGFGNPSSLHSFGEEAASAVTKARSTIADALGCFPDEIIFTSGGSEADNHAALILENYAKSTGRRSILTSGAEHHAVLSPVKALGKSGLNVKILNPDGDIDLFYNKILCAAESAEADLAGGSFMTVNNETGHIFDICKISRIIHGQGGLVHTDAVQAVGHIPVSFKESGVDMMSLSAHKFHGPKGVGALICRRGVEIPSFILGGAQERGHRAGTENVAGIVGMAAALSECAENLNENIRITSKLRNMLSDGLASLGAIVGDGDSPNILSVRFPDGDGEALVRSLDLFGIAASAGAACNSTAVGVSHVLLSMGLSEAEAAATVRFSLDPSNTENEIRRIISVVGELV